MTEELFWKYMQCGGGAELGEPRTPEHVEPNGQVRYREFQRGSIYWTPQTGAKLVDEKILSHWRSMGDQDRSKLGYPTSDSDRMQDSSRVYNRFQGGTISYSLNGECVAYFDRTISRDIRRKISIGIAVGFWLIVAFIIFITSKGGIGQGILTVVTALLGPLTAILIDLFWERSHSYEGL